MMQIVDWRVAQCEAASVDLRYNVFAEVPDVLAETPDVVVVATGGMAIPRSTRATPPITSSPPGTSCRAT